MRTVATPLRVMISHPPFWILLMAGYASSTLGAYLLGHFLAFRTSEFLAEAMGVLLILLAILTVSKRIYRDGLREGEVLARQAEPFPPKLILDEQLRERCYDLLLREGMYDTAVREAVVVLEDRIRNVVGVSDLFGARLVDQAFDTQVGQLVFSPVANEQQSIHHLYRGVMGFFRNPVVHRLIPEYTQDRARQVIALIDLLACLLSDARPRNETKQFLDRPEELQD